MGTKTVRIDEDVYERIKSEKRPDETFSETIERLVGGASLLDLVGILSEEEADAFRDAIEDADATAKRDVSELLDRYEE